jgi:hypothetical protein
MEKGSNVNRPLNLYAGPTGPGALDAEATANVATGEAVGLKFFSAVIVVPRQH